MASLFVDGFTVRTSKLRRTFDNRKTSSQRPAVRLADRCSATQPIESPRCPKQVSTRPNHCAHRVQYLRASTVTWARHRRQSSSFHHIRASPSITIHPFPQTLARHPSTHPRLRPACTCELCPSRSQLFTPCLNRPPTVTTRVGVSVDPVKRRASRGACLVFSVRDRIVLGPNVLARQNNS